MTIPTAMMQNMQKNITTKTLYSSNGDHYRGNERSKWMSRSQATQNQVRQSKCVDNVTLQNL